MLKESLENVVSIESFSIVRIGPFFKKQSLKIFIFFSLLSTLVASRTAELLGDGKPFAGCIVCLDSADVKIPDELKVNPNAAARIETIHTSWLGKFTNFWNKFENNCYHIVLLSFS